MRILATTIILSSLLFASPYNLTPKQVNGDVYCFFGKPEIMNQQNNGDIVNSCYILGSDGYIVIDTGPSYRYSESAFNEMQKISKKDVALVINTHIHDDHWLGNNFFSGVEIVGSDDFLINASVSEPTRMGSFISKEAYEKTIPTLPNKIISSDTHVISSNKKLQLIMAKKKAHTAKDMIVYLPDDGVLFAGDLVFNTRIPTLGNGDINGWIEALEFIKTFNVKYIIGGHGDRVDSKSYEMTLEYFTELRDEVVKAIDDGLDISEAIDKITMDSFKKYALYDEVHRHNVEAAYRTLEWR